jgi:hypothetical protein
LNIPDSLYESVCVPLLGAATTLFFDKKPRPNNYREFIYVWKSDCERRVQDKVFMLRVSPSFFRGCCETRPDWKTDNPSWGFPRWFYIFCRCRLCSLYALMVGLSCSWINSAVGFSVSTLVAKYSRCFLQTDVVYFMQNKLKIESIVF